MNPTANLPGAAMGVPPQNTLHYHHVHHHHHYYHHHPHSPMRTTAIGVVMEMINEEEP